MSSLPIELYRPIVSQMHPEDDSSTLISLALSSQALRSESQSVLFRTVFRSLWGNFSNGNDLQRRHTQFLQAIITSPSRLGPLVHSYSQWNILLYKRQATSQIIELTSEALKFMVNLKELRLSCQPGFNFLEPKEWTFQLETLQVSGMPSTADEWLYTQNQLRHIDLSMPLFHSGADRRRFALSLRSITGNLGDLNVIAPGRSIIAFDYAVDELFRPSYQNSNIRGIEASKDIKYLRVLDFHAFFALLNKSLSFTSMLMLEIGRVGSSPQFLDNFSRLPHTLRVLVIYEGFWMTNIRFPEADIKVWLARNLFSMLPDLHYLDIREKQDNRSRVLESRYYRPTVGDAAIRMMHTMIEGFWGDGDDWWRYHDLELRSLSH